MPHDPYDWERPEWEEDFEEVQGEYYEITVAKFTPDGDETIDVIIFDDDEGGWESTYELDNGRTFRLRLEVI